MARSKKLLQKKELPQLLQDKLTKLTRQTKEIAAKSKNIKTTQKYNEFLAEANNMKTLLHDEWNQATNSKYKDRIQSLEVMMNNTVDEVLVLAGPTAKKSTGAKKSSRSRRAGLLFPVGRVQRYLKEESCGVSKISAGAPVYVAAVLEYLVAEVLELAGKSVKVDKRKRVDAQDIVNALYFDEDMVNFSENAGVQVAKATVPRMAIRGKQFNMLKERFKRKNFGHVNLDD